MKQFVTVLKFELNNYFKNKSFMLTTILLAVLMVGVIVVPTFIPGLLKEDTSGKKQDTQIQEEAEESESLGIFVDTGEVQDVDSLLSSMPYQWKTYEDENSIKEAVKANEIEGGFILHSASEVTYVVNNLAVEDRLSEEFSSALAAHEKRAYLMGKGLTAEEAAAADMVNINLEPEILGKNSVRNYAYTYALVFIIYFLILFYGQMIAVSVTTEKSNRAIEILVTSVNPNSLIFGKVLAGAIAGVLQMVLIVGSGFAAYGAFKDAWGGGLDFLFNIPGRVLAAYAVFGTLSYLLYAFIYGTLGALVSKTEDISKSSTPITIVYVASFLVAMLGLTNTDSLMVKVASYIPFTSGNAMFIRVSMGSVGAWEIILSGLILLLSCIVTGIFAAKLFRFGTLHYGNPLKFTKALKSVKEQQ
ncbi:MAG: ABC transporter permease [Eubacteriales bacterium]|nr:ABC transporter permease [Eubacteriales bacterium]